MSDTESSGLYITAKKYWDIVEDEHYKVGEELGIPNNMSKWLILVIIEAVIIVLMILFFLLNFNVPCIYHFLKIFLLFKNY